jgi:uncharacterized Zn finger protein
MENKCPECGSGSVILIDTNDRRHAKCLECGEITPAEPPTLLPLNAERGKGDATL